MTNEEAIEILNEERDYTQFSKYVKEAIEIATSAIKKQIPKKVKIFEEYFVLCPVCNFYIEDIDFISGKSHKYCDLCGQALDWSDT